MAPRRHSTQLAMPGLAKPRPAPVALPTQAEKAFMANVIELAGLLHWRHWHDAATNAPRACWHCGRRWTGPRNPAGMLDLILVRRPRLVWMELKSEDGAVTVDQQDWIDDLQASGQEVYVFKPSDWTEIVRILT